VVSKAKRKARPVAPVTWRDGIHLSGTSIWCDAIRARNICFLSEANAMRGAKHAQLIASQDTLNLVRPGKSEAGSRLAVPFGQPFTLGTHRIELFSSGHGLGAASLLVKVETHKVVYAGAVNPRGSVLGGPLDHRSADILVLSGRYGTPRFAFPPEDSVSASLGQRCSEIVQAGGVAVLLVGDTGKALDLASRLGSDLEIQVHRGIQEAGRRSRPNLFGGLRRWNEKTKTGRVLLWPIHTRSKLDRSVLPKASQVLLVSGQALDPDCIAAAGADEGFALSNQADHDELVRYIRGSGASQVYLTQSSDRGQGLQEALPKHTIEAIGPPEQLSLFGS
tara:strand:+ start:9976 stop:10980 length:1005 start_codon:yes stop_codon:yes gene_type:complete